MVPRILFHPETTSLVALRDTIRGRAAFNADE
jgi:hypothetical protein